MNFAAMSMSAHVSEFLLSILLGTYLGMELRGHTVILRLAFEELRVHCSLRIAHAGEVLGNQKMVIITCTDACSQIPSL